MAEPHRVIHMVGIHCRPDQEEKVNRWYNEQHIPDLMKFKGLKKATRYRLLYPGEIYPGYPEMKYPGFLSVYEFDSKEDFDAYQASPELADCQPNVRETWADDPMERLWRVQYEEINTFEQP